MLRQVTRMQQLNDTYFEQLNYFSAVSSKKLVEVIKDLDHGADTNTC